MWKEPTGVIATQLVQTPSEAIPACVWTASLETDCNVKVGDDSADFFFNDLIKAEEKKRACYHILLYPFPQP